MKYEKLHELMEWLSSQLEHVTTSINEACEKKNKGPEAQYERMRSTFLHCLNTLKRE